MKNICGTSVGKINNGFNIEDDEKSQKNKLKIPR